MWVAAALVVVGGVAYHVHRHLTHELPPSAVPHAPAHTAVAVRGTGKYLSATPGHPVDARELERFKAVEESKGNVVLEVAPGTWMVVPAAEAAARAARKGTP
jgi:hypothetical protein